VLNYAKQGYKKLRNYIESIFLPTLLKRSHFEGFNKRQIKDTIDWHYFQQTPRTTSHLFASLTKIQTELAYELPLLKTIELLSTSFDINEDQIVSSDLNLTVPIRFHGKDYGTMGKLLNVEDIIDDQPIANVEKNNIFVYVFHHSNAIDMRGSINYFGGAQHSSDLPFLFGPSLFKQISRRRLTQTEDKLCRKFHEIFGDFIKTG
jgi:Carboxylesterase family